MNKNKSILAILLLSVAVIGLFSSGCAAGINDVDSSRETPTEQEEILKRESTQAPQEEENPEPDQAVDNAAAEEVDHCLDCHTDKQTLIDTAEEVVEVEAENEGEG